MKNLFSVRLRVVAVNLMIYAMVGLATGKGVARQWWENPQLQNKVFIGALSGSSGHYWPISDQFMFVSAAGGGPGPAHLFSISDLRNANVDDVVEPLASVNHPDLLGVNNFRGGAVSDSRGRVLSGTAIPGVKFPDHYASLPTDGTEWTSNNVARITLGKKVNIDGMAFNNDGTKLFSNDYDNPDRSNLYTWLVGDLTQDGEGLTIENTFTSSVTRIRCLRSYFIDGQDLVYYGDGGSAAPYPVMVYDPSNGIETELIADMGKAVHNLAVSGIGTDQMYVHVSTDAGREISVYELNVNGKGVGAKVLDSFCFSQEILNDGIKAATAFNVTSDGQYAFFGWIPDTGSHDRFLYVVASPPLVKGTLIRFARR